MMAFYPILRVSAAPAWPYWYFDPRWLRSGQ